MNKGMNFFKTFLAALLAIIVANFAVGMFVMMVLAGVMLSVGQGSQQDIADNTVLIIDLATPINDSPDISPKISMDLNNIRYNRTITLFDALKAIDYASIDSNISGIYINVQSDNLPLASLEELRRAIDQFRQSGKFVVSYNNIYSQSAYYLSSVSDKVYMNPQGSFAWHGISSTAVFFKGLLDKLGIQAEVFRHGTFKAAVEPFIQDKMSDQSRLQTNVMLGSMWGAILEDVGLSRGIDSADLNRYADQLTIRTADDAMTYGFIDDVLYQDEIFRVINRLVEGGRYDDYEDEADIEELEEALLDGEPISDDMVGLLRREKHDIVALSRSEQPTFVTLTNYIRHTVSLGVLSNNSTNKIAIIYADGEIVDGTSSKSSVGDLSLASKLAKARMDNDVKAVVLRVNSPGGSAIASEAIWRAMEVLRSVKPVVVSFGSVAASGGYYISCGADAIFANRTTLTGSIGVFGLMINAQKGLKDNIGITVDIAKTNKSADLGMPFRDITEQERMYMQYSVDRVYETFVANVAQGRNMSYDAVDKIAEGRIWGASDADRIGLIDGFGGIIDAVEYAADRAGVAGDYKAVQIVNAQGRFAALLGAVTEIVSVKARSEMGDMFIHYNSLKSTLEQSGKVQARMPYMIEVAP